MKPRLSYPSDITDAQWAVLAPLIPPPKPGGRPARYSRREILNAIFYVVRTGCPWRSLPHDFPPYRIVYWYLMTWRNEGLWRKIHDRLREQLRRAESRHSQPSAGILDSQSIKTTEKGGSMAMTPARKSAVASGTCLSM